MQHMFKTIFGLVMLACLVVGFQTVSAANGKISPNHMNRARTLPMYDAGLTTDGIEKMIYMLEAQGRISPFTADSWISSLDSDKDAVVLKLQALLDKQVLYQKRASQKESEEVDSIQ